MIRDLAIFEPTSCRCSTCAGPCHSRGSQPGALAPSDLDSIAEHLGLEEPSEDFIARNFVAATDGPGAPTPEFPSGETPAIRPAVRKDGPRAGQCIFLAENGDCTIYPVRPFECGRVNQCAPEEGAAAMRALGVAITKSVDMIQMWWWLWKRQKFTTTIIKPDSTTPKIDWTL